MLTFRGKILSRILQSELRMWNTHLHRSPSSGPFHEETVFTNLQHFPLSHWWTRTVFYGADRNFCDSYALNSFLLGLRQQTGQFGLHSGE